MELKNAMKALKLTAVGFILAPTLAAASSPALDELKATAGNEATAQAASVRQAPPIATCIAPGPDMACYKNQEGKALSDTNAGVELKVDVMKDIYKTSFSYPKESLEQRLFGHGASLDMAPGDSVALSFDSTVGIGEIFYSRKYTSVVSVSLVSDDASCGNGQMMLKLDNQYSGSVSPSATCLPRDFGSRQILVQVQTSVQAQNGSNAALPVTFELTATSR